MKKFGIYIVCALFGLLIGWFLFGQKTDTHKVDEEVHATVDQQWTCSMHPQILLPDQGMDLIPVDESGAGLHPNAIKMTANAMALANIETHVVGEVENRNASLNLSGKIRPNEQTNATQTAHFTGRIEQLHVNTTGERVHKGQLLATIYSPELVTAQLQFFQIH